MKFSCIFLITFWYTLYLSENGTAMEDENFVIQPDDEEFNDIIEKSSEIDSSDIERNSMNPIFEDENFVNQPDDEEFNDIIEKSSEIDSSDMQRNSMNPLFGDENFVIQPNDEELNDISEKRPESVFPYTQRKGKNKKPNYMRNCLDLKNKGYATGTYLITPCDDTPAKVVKVYCDMDSDHGGWTVIQRRDFPETTEFNNTWYEYAMGFGDVLRDFWLGNNNIHCLCAQTPNEIRFDLTYWNGTKGFANYGFFYVSGETQKYKMEAQNYTGNVGDRFSYHSNNSFSTYDQDNDRYSAHCAGWYGRGGWWFKSCWTCLLTGQYNSSMQWGSYVKKSEMKIRPSHS